MTKAMQESMEISPGVFELDGLRRFDKAQAWELTAYYNHDYFGNEADSHKVFQVNNMHCLVDNTDFVFTYLVLRMNYLRTGSLKRQQENLDNLKSSIEETEDTRIAFTTLQSKVDEKKIDWQQAHRQRMAEIILTRREDLHVLTDVKKYGGEITGFFGKLWGITVTDTDKNGFEVYSPVIVGKDLQASVKRMGKASAWLYQGSVE